MINVTKTYLPPLEEYITMLKRVWDNNWITNNGELLVELENKLKDFLGVEYLLVCSNGTIVLQLALKALNIKREVITTPFSYVATTNAILWEGCKPVFADIHPGTFCIDPEKVEAAITENTEAILATHVFGFPCDIDAIQKISEKYNLKVIYDGAHAFGCSYKGESLFGSGDISTCSFHATKIFHTVEGGLLVCKDKATYDKLFLFRQFGHIYDDYHSAGINAKQSELHAAMGLCLLPKVKNFIQERKALFGLYQHLLKDINLFCYTGMNDFNYNYSYYPLLLEEEEILFKVKNALEKNRIFPRRYFFPSLNNLNYLHNVSMPVSDSVSSRILCLPLYNGISEKMIEDVCGIIFNNING